MGGAARLWWTWSDPAHNLEQVCYGPRMNADITLSVEDFAAAISTDQPLLGLDLGTKTLGLALSDLGQSIASPLTTIRRKKFAADAEELEALIDEHGVAGLVLGFPINMDGSEGPRAQATRAFARNFTSRRAIPILLWDERLSTVAAERALLEADQSRKRRGEVIDKVAAAFILQGCA